MKLSEKSVLKYSYITAFPVTFLLLSWLIIDKQSPENIMVPVIFISAFLNFFPAFILEALYLKVFSKTSDSDLAKEQTEKADLTVTHRQKTNNLGPFIITLIFGPVTSYCFMLPIASQGKQYLTLLAIALGLIVTFIISKMWLNKNT